MARKPRVHISGGLYHVMLRGNGGQIFFDDECRPAALLDIFNEHEGHMCISSITLAELLHGAEKSERQEHNLNQVEDFISRLEVLTYDEKSAAHYGNIRADLEGKGKTIGVNDLHIAGHARSEGLILVTNNEKEFNRVDALRIENWV